MYNKIVIGIDQSYEDTGISIVADGIVKAKTNVLLKELKDNTERRRALAKKLVSIIVLAERRAREVVIVIERIRLRSGGFISMDYIKAIGSLNAVIVDTSRDYGKKVYSADTRAWKSSVVGTSKEKINKYGIDPKKYPTILFVRKLLGNDGLYREATNREKKGIIELNGKRVKFNDNICDAVCIGLYGFKPNAKLQEEH